MSSNVETLPDLQEEDNDDDDEEEGEDEEEEEEAESRDHDREVAGSVDTRELVPDYAAAASTSTTTKLKKRSIIDSLLCRKRIPSVKDSLAVIGLREALLVGMLSNIETNDKDGSVKTNDTSTETRTDGMVASDDSMTQDPSMELATNLTSVSLLKSEAVVHPQQHPHPQRSNFKRPACSFADSSVGSTSVSSSAHSSEENTTPPNEGRSSAGRASSSSSHIRLTARRTTTTATMSTPPPVRMTPPPAVGLDTEGLSSSDSSFAAMMFGRDGPKLTPKDMLNIPLTAPPDTSTSSPKTKSTTVDFAATKRGYQKGKGFIGVVQSSSSETLVDVEDSRILRITARTSRRHSTNVMAMARSTDSPSTPPSGRRIDRRRYSMQPERLHYDLLASGDRNKSAEDSNSLPGLGREKASWNDVVRRHELFSTRHSSSLPVVKAGVRSGRPNSGPVSSVPGDISSLSRQSTLQVPPFTYGGANLLTVPVEVNNPPWPPARTFQSRPRMGQTSSSSSSTAARRRLRAQQLKRQKSIDNSPYDSAEESATSLVTKSRTSEANQKSGEAAICLHCAKSLDNLDKYDTSCKAESPRLRRLQSMRRKVLSVDETTKGNVWAPGDSINKTSSIKVTHL